MTFDGRSRLILHRFMMYYYWLKTYDRPRNVLQLLSLSTRP